MCVHNSGQALKSFAHDKLLKIRSFSHTNFHSKPGDDNGSNNERGDYRSVEMECRLEFSAQKVVGKKNGQGQNYTYWSLGHHRQANQHIASQSEAESSAFRGVEKRQLASGH